MYIQEIHSNRNIAIYIIYINIYTHPQHHVTDATR